MLQKIIDLHVHSKYSRACSQQLTLSNIAKACETKGIDIVATGDFTHPVWFKDIWQLLKETAPGIYQLKNSTSSTRFVLCTEIACIYSHRGKLRRQHVLLLAPAIATVESTIKTLKARKVNVQSDGRPLMGLSPKQVLQMLLEIDEQCMVIPAHAWTPWFGILGSKSDYDSVEECFEELTPYVAALETGLSADPAMTRRVSALDHFALVSNSDAHSLDNLGREANVFSFADESDITYHEIRRIIREGDRNKFLYTIEFFPQEGKYYYDGHRTCGIVLHPRDTIKIKGVCPVCKKPLTIGVLHRVDDLADRAEQNIPWKRFIGQRYLVPLRAIIGHVFGVGSGSKKTAIEYNTMIRTIGSEFYCLLHASAAELRWGTTDERIVQAVERMRAGKVQISPGYDGVYGTVAF